MNAVAILVGTIVGAGIFALPETTARAGFPVAAVWLLGLTATVVLLHLMFGEVILRTTERHRLPGYAARYLGKHAGQLATFSGLFGGVGSLLIYVSFADLFLTKLFPVLHAGQGGIAAWCVLALAVVFGIRTVGRAELFMTILLIVAMGAVVAAAMPHIVAANLFAIGGAGNAMLPYGVFLFSLWGVNAIPEMRELFGENARGFARAIFTGTAIPAFLYLVFITATVGAFGTRTIGGLPALFSSFSASTGIAIAVFGALAVATSFLVLGAYLVDVLRYDLRVSQRYALLALLAPLFLFAVGARDVVAIIGVVGVVLGAVDGVLIALTWRAARYRGDHIPAYALRLPAGIAYAMMALLLGGTGVEVFLKALL